MYKRTEDLWFDVSEVLMLDKFSYGEIADMFGLSVEEVAGIDGELRIFEAEYNGGFQYD